MRGGWVSIVALAAACQGQIGGELPRPSASPSPSPSPSPSASPTVSPSPTPSPSPTVEPELPAFAPAPASLRRLTRIEYQNTIADVLGPGLPVPTDLEADTTLHGFTTVAASALNVGPLAAEQYEKIALDLSARVFADPARRAALLGCAPATVEDPCVRTFLERFGRRAWRRPLTSAELDRWVGVARAVDLRLGDVATSLELVTAGLLQSPAFLYRVELGVSDPADPTRRAYTGWEMASRLSYLIWGTTPDDALLTAAEGGALDTPGGLTVEARRLLADPRAKVALGRFFAEHFKLDRLAGITKDLATFPQMNGALPAAMRAEIEQLIARVVFDRNTDLREIFDTRSTFVNADLARVYNLPGVRGPGMVEVTLPDNSPRAGVLTTAGFLALYSHASVTSPTLRGRFVRQSLLCQEIEPPPAGLITELPEVDPNAPPQTLRQRLETLHLAVQPCSGCHSRMDPLGFGFEAFDAIGAYRTTDNGLPVDASGSFDGQAFRNARELASRVKASPAVSSCLVKMAYRYASGHRETDGERRTLRALDESLAAANYRFQDFVVALVTSDGFRMAGE